MVNHNGVVNYKALEHNSHKPAQLLALFNFLRHFKAVQTHDNYHFVVFLCVNLKLSSFLFSCSSLLAPNSSNATARAFNLYCSLQSSVANLLVTFCPPMQRLVLNVFMRTISHVRSNDSRAIHHWNVHI